MGLYYALDIQPECNITPLTWGEYKSAMLKGKGKNWDRMLNADLVWGGLEFDADFM